MVSNPARKGNTIQDIIEKKKMMRNNLPQTFFQALFLFSIVRINHIKAWMAPFHSPSGSLPASPFSYRHHYNLAKSRIKDFQQVSSTYRRTDLQGLLGKVALWREGWQLSSLAGDEGNEGGDQAGNQNSEDPADGGEVGDPSEEQAASGSEGSGEEVQSSNLSTDSEPEAVGELENLSISAEEEGSNSEAELVSEEEKVPGLEVDEDKDDAPGMLDILSRILRPQQAGPGEISEGSMSLAYRSDNGTRNSEFYLEGETPETMNPYVDIVRRLSPGETIGRFMRTAPENVQVAVRNTIMGLMGSLRQYGVETTAITTGENLANLMFQLQMTGYMFRNAEYRLSVQRSLTGGLPYHMPKSALLLPGESLDDDGEEEPEMSNWPAPKISGVIKLTMDNGQEIEVDADAYMGELRSEVEKLQSELVRLEQQRDSALEKDLLLYIKSLPEENLRSLTETISPEVLEAMRIMVTSIMASMGTSQLGNTLTQQTGSAMAQICMWQLVAGYNLRELEQREQMKRLFDSS
mmetsp:Transcript_15383/g.19273  ORF Transcript_15383/g.19273 Transcript_15383/m.19273 type:complete len:521 (+) Transcript_15383:57-1619(+)